MAKTKSAAAKAAPMKTIKKNGVVYALITPSHLTGLKNKLAKAVSKSVAQAPVAIPTTPRNGGPDTIPGTTNTVFTVFASMAAGVAGFRRLGDGQFRVRVVPNNDNVWLDWPNKPADGLNRFSKVVGVSDLPETVAEATLALASASV